MNIRAYAFFALPLLLIALLIRAPASLLAPVLADRSTNRLQLVDAQGSLWSGAAGVSCVLPEGTAVNCGRWAWNLVPANLTHGRLSLLVRRQSAAESMLLSWTPAGLTVENVAVTLPAALAGSIDGRVAALRLGGRLQITSQALSGSAGEARIVWQKMESGLLPGQAIGDHVVNVATTASGSNFTITSLTAPVVLSGGGSLARDGQATIDVLATVDPKNTALPPLLSLMGKEVAPGQFRFKMP